MIFGIEENTNSIETISESMIGTQEELLSILSEGLNNIFQIRTQILKESISIEERYINDEITINESSIILESSFGEKIEAAKAVLSNLKDKFIAWVTKMITNLKLFISNYENFIKKNKEKIEELKNSGKKVSIKIYDIDGGSKFVDDLLVESRNTINDICRLSDKAFRGNNEKMDELMEYIEESDVLLTDSNDIIQELNIIINKNEQPQEMDIPVDMIINQMQNTKNILKRFESYKKEFEKSSTNAIKTLSMDAVKNMNNLADMENGMQGYSYALASVTVLLTHVPKVIFHLCETNKRATLEYLRILKDALK